MDTIRPPPSSCLSLHLRREKVLGQIAMLVKQFVKETYKRLYVSPVNPSHTEAHCHHVPFSGCSDEQAEQAGGKIFTFGSYRYVADPSRSL